MSAYATPSDVEVELGRSAASPAELDQWQLWLDRVERRIRRQFVRAGLNLETQLGFSKPSLAELVDVETAAVVRKIQNPLWGETSITRSVDDASVTSRRDGGGAERDPLELLDSEWFSLLPNIRPSRARIYSVLPS